MANIELRSKKFDKLFYLNRSNPYYNKLKYLYVNDDLKSTASVRKYFDKIKIKDNKELYKKSIKYVNELNDRYEQIYNKTTLKQNQLNKRFIRIDENNIDNFDIWIHEAEIRALQKTNSNGYYVQTTKFYNNRGNLNDGIFKPVNIKTSLMLNSKAKRKIVYEQIMNKLTVGGSEYDWKISAWILEDRQVFIDNNEMSIKNTKKIGLWLFSKYEFDFLNNFDTKFVNNANNTFSYFFDLLKILYTNYMKKFYKKIPKNTLYIDFNFNHSSFDLSKDDRIFLYNIGDKKSKKFFNKINKQNRKRYLSRKYFNIWWSKIIKKI